jgi:glycine/D-amino acid oxidase-like deaminating enzyme
MKCDVAIVGAGPYGLSLAAHLAAQKIAFRIFGPAMDTWRNAMPAGMFLKSEGFASSLSDPGQTFTLAHYSTANGIPYADTGLPVPLKVFSDYCLAFKERFAPNHDSRSITRIERDEDGFWLTLEDGELVSATRVVVAAGITHYAHMPREFTGLPEAFVSHASQHADLAKFRGKKVAVIGAGASALDTAALLVEHGASVEIVARNRKVHFHNPPTGRPRSVWESFKAPMSGLGPGWRSRLCTDAPLLFRALPEALRLKIVDKHLGPAPGWWTRGATAGKVTFNLGAKLLGAMPKGGKVALEFEDASGKWLTVECDHIIAATGYVVDIRRLPFLTAPLLSDIKTASDHSPDLSARFESTVPGLYFIGVSAAASFGPMMRFAYGAAYTAKQVARDLARKTRTRSVPLPGSAPEQSAPSRA